MSKWLNCRKANDPVPHHELFGTVAEAKQALENVLALHQQKGHEVTTEQVGRDIRWIISECDEFVAKYWLSDDKEDIQDED